MQVPRTEACMHGLSAQGQVTISNDGATIMKLLEIVHPAAKSLVDVSLAQDAEVRMHACMVLGCMGLQAGCLPAGEQIQTPKLVLSQPLPWGVLQFAAGQGVSERKRKWHGLLLALCPDALVRLACWCCALVRRPAGAVP